MTATADGEGNATVKWSTDEPSTSLVEYGRTTTLGEEVSETALTSKHERRAHRPLARTRRTASA